MIGLNDLTDPACKSQERCLAFSWCWRTFFSDRYWFSQAGFAPRIAHGNVGICVGWTFNVRPQTFVFCCEEKTYCVVTQQRNLSTEIGSYFPKDDIVCEQLLFWPPPHLPAEVNPWCDGYLMRVVEHIIYNLCLSVVQSISQKLSLGAHSNLAMGIVGARINSWINWMPPTSSSSVTEPLSNMIVYDLGLCSGHPNWCWDSSQSLPFAWACAHDKVGMSRILGWPGFMICWPDSDLKKYVGLFWWSNLCVIITAK